MRHTRRHFLQNSATALVAASVPMAALGDGSRHVAEATESATSPSLDNFTAGYTPLEIGGAAAARFLVTDHIKDPDKFYAEVCAWVGALQFARATANRALISKLKNRFDELFPTDSAANLPPAGRHVDLSVFGALPLELFRATGEPRYEALGLRYADAQWAEPDAAGLSSETRFWIDDMYMITMLQVQAFRMTKDVKYLDRAALETAAYLDKLQQANGLFFHAPDVPFYWARGNGWFAVGMAELLIDLPASHRHHASVLRGFHRMMAGLLATQTTDGTWRELLDRPDAWPESSGSGMFTFAFITGLRLGLLDRKTYAAATRRAWQALAGYVDQNGDVTDVCEGTSKQNSAEWYLNRKRRTGDLRGQAPLLWSAAALLT